jgi:acyl-CoA oxidase
MNNNTTPSTSTSTTTMHPDLEMERAQATFDVERITNFLDGAKGGIGGNTHSGTANGNWGRQTARRRQIERLIRTDPSGVFDNTLNAYLPRQERHVRALAKAVRMMEVGRQIGAMPTAHGDTDGHGHGDDEDEDDTDTSTTANADFGTLVAAVADDLPLALHWIMFVPNIVSLCDAQQQKLWLPQCLDFKMIGCYAQTELGHGSNIRALETTATFQTHAQSGLEGGAWIIHTPTLTATKFWPGTLGRTANHAMVIARLIDGRGEDRGIHNFLVPLRSMTDHTPLEGVKVGDIGPKIGYNNMDNGFASFDQVVIPRRHMAMRFATVDESGVYQKIKVAPAASRIAYITMMQVRAHIINEAGKNLSMACCIVIRYSAVRRQGYDASDSSGKREVQILEYTQQQHRILPLLAASYCFFFTGRKVLQNLMHMERQLVNGNDGNGNSNHKGVTKEQVADMHASTSCLKSFSTTVAADGIEECRKACGGHGFLVASGLPELLGTYLQNPTVEGDNHMLPQQTVRVLLKLVQAVVSQDEVQIAAYNACGESGYLVPALQQLIAAGGAATPNATTPATGDLDLNFCLNAFQTRTARLLFGVSQQLQDNIASGKTMQESWNDGLIQFARVARSHSMAIILKDTITSLAEEEAKGISTNSASGSCLSCREIAVLLDLALLFGLYWMEKDMGDFLETGILCHSMAPRVRAAVLQQLKVVRPNAVPLVDARDFSDFRLKSALGRYDGHVYPALFETSLKEGLNATEPGPGYQDHLRRLIVDGVGAAPPKSSRHETKGVSGTVSRL